MTTFNKHTTPTSKRKSKPRPSAVPPTDRRKTEMFVQDLLRKAGVQVDVKQLNELVNRLLNTKNKKQ